MATSALLPVFKAFVQAMEEARSPTAWLPDQPGFVSLPPELGTREAPSAEAGRTIATSFGLFSFVRAKARFVGLPTAMVDTIRDEIRPPVIFSNILLRGVASVRYIRGTVLTVQLAPTVPLELWHAFTSLGSKGPLTDTQTLGTVYHELTHGWMVYFIARDPFWQQLQDKAIKDYRQRLTAAGSDLDPRDAFLEASASYVNSRVQAWSSTLQTLNHLWATPEDDPGTLARIKDLAVKTRDEYDAALAQSIYGFVNGVPVPVAIPQEVRKALDVHLLESLPLVKAFRRFAPFERLVETILAR